MAYIMMAYTYIMMACTYIMMAYIMMAYTYIMMAYIMMAYIMMAYTYIMMASIMMAYISASLFMVQTFMAYIFMFILKNIRLTRRIGMIIICLGPNPNPNPNPNTNGILMVDVRMSLFTFGSDTCWIGVCPQGGLFRVNIFIFGEHASISIHEQFAWRSREHVLPPTSQ